MLNFVYEDDIKIRNKYFPATSRILYLSKKTIRRSPQSHETIPLIMPGQLEKGKFLIGQTNLSGHPIVPIQGVMKQLPVQILYHILSVPVS
jgi:hypothetical protein